MSESKEDNTHFYQIPIKKERRHSNAYKQKNILDDRIYKLAFEIKQMNLSKKNNNSSAKNLSRLACIMSVVR